MGEHSKIEWTDHTFNPWIGCQKVSSACDNCYAEAWAKRAGRDFSIPQRTIAANWREPLKWNRRVAESGTRQRVFCASLADVFDNRAPNEWRADLWTLIRSTPHLDWLIVTKRIGNAARMLPEDWGNGYPNVWLLATVSRQAEADRDIPKLLQVPAVVHGLSMEPLLGPVNIGRWLQPYKDQILDWVVVGGESGPKARPSHPDWFRSLRDQCQAAGVPFVFKQHGEYREFAHGPDHQEIVVGSEEAARCIAQAKAPKWITIDGRMFSSQEEIPADTPARLVERISKKAAGRLLDGRTWDEFPAANENLEDEGKAYEYERAVELHP
jgi:protein gp37